MNKDQWTVVGLLVVLAGLEIIRSGAVQGFFSNFFSQFGVGSPSSSSSSAPTVSAGASLPTGNVAGNRIKGMPGNQ